MDRPARPSRLAQPEGYGDLLLFRINRLRAVGGGLVLRYCEGQFGITRREWVMLALLGNGGPVSSSELAARAELDKSATSKAVTALLHKGLVERHTRTGDRRVAQLVLTAQGAELVRRILPVVKRINRAVMAGLSADEVVLLDSMLDRMQHSADRLLAEEAGGLPPVDRRHGGTRPR